MTPFEQVNANRARGLRDRKPVAIHQYQTDFADFRVFQTERLYCLTYMGKPAVILRTSRYKTSYVYKVFKTRHKARSEAAKLRRELNSPLWSYCELYPSEPPRERNEE